VEFSRRDARIKLATCVASWRTATLLLKWDKYNGRRGPDWSILKSALDGGCFAALLLAQHDCWINLHCASRRHDTGD
jgi:hypothetical protein